MTVGKTEYRGWEYARLGDYHRNPDPNWSYTPTYLHKMEFVRRIVESLPRDSRILDAGCGEGVLVEEYCQKGWHVEGLDLNYESEYVRRGDVRDMPYPDVSLDAALFLDTLEHLAYEDQTKALSEIHRILRPGGYLILSVPNLAHLNSRVRFLLKGRLDRTDAETNHVGERPLWENEKLLRKSGFAIKERIGVTLTLPVVYRRVICKRPGRYRWLHDALEPFARVFPSLAMLTIFVCKKEDRPLTHERVGILKRMQIARLGGHFRMFSIFTHLTERERVLLFELSRSLSRNSRIVEIGSYLGASTFFLAAGARSRSGKVFAVDTWSNMGMSEGPRETYDDFVRNVAPLGDSIFPIKGLSIQVAKGFDGEIDLLFVDGDHSYEAVRADLEAWLPKVKKAGIVVLHDYAWAGGVQRAAKELVIPLQVEGGRRIDTTYWTRIGTNKMQQGKPAVKVSLIVSTYGRPVSLKDTLVSLLQQDISSEQYEIIVVDNKPMKDVYRIIQELELEWQRSIHYVEEPRIGLHNARHAGARTARGEILAYVDDDVVAPPGWLKALLKSYTDPQVACAGGKILPKWEAEPPAWVAQFGENGGINLSLLDLGDETLELAWPQGVHGCNMSVRRSALFEVGGYNPDAIGDQRRIWLRGDGESGLHKKLYDAGYKVIYEPQAWLYHRVPASRLRPEYFCWRAFIQGISDSYTHMRTRRLPIIRLLGHSGRCVIMAGRSYARSLRESEGRILSRSRAWYWYGRAQHQLRLARSPSLRRHVTQETYL